MKKSYDEQINDIMRDKELSRIEKTEKIREIHQKQTEKYENEYFWATFRNWAGGAIIIGSSVIPVTHVVKILGTAAKISPIAARLLPSATKLLVTNLKMNKPIIKQIIANAIKRGIIEGGFASVFYGIGINIQEDHDFKKSVENLANIVITGIVLGALLGSFSGVIGTKLGRGKELIETFLKRKDWGIAFRKSMGNPRFALELLLKNQRGFVPRAIYKKGLGNIDFVWGKSGKRGYGFSHIISERNDNGLNGIEFLRMLINIINSGRIGFLKNQPNIRTVRLGDDQALIKLIWDKYKRNWVVTAFRDKNKLPNAVTSRTPDIASISNEMTPSLTANGNLVGDAENSRIYQQGINNVPYSSKTNNPHVGNNTKTRIRQALVTSILNSINKRNGELKGTKFEPIDYNQKYEFIPEDYDYNSYNNGNFPQIQNNYPQMPNDKLDTTNYAKTKVDLLKVLVILIGEILNKNRKERVYHQNYEFIPEDYDYNSYNNGNFPQNQNETLQPQNGHWVTIKGNHVFIEDK